MKTDRNDTNDRKACLLVLAYWLYKVINGGNVIKTTFRVAERAQEPALSAHRNVDPARTVP